MSYEKEIEELIEQNRPLPPKIEISLIKYFWQSNPFFRSAKDSIPRFLRRIKVLKNFSENELRILSRYIHLRDFSQNETIFKQFDLGMGFYFIFSGQVDVIVENDKDDILEEDLPKSRHIITLERGDYFGELALLQQRSLRNATAKAREGCILLGIFKPDLELLINEYPVVATKLLQSVSVIIANRLFSITKEVRRLKHRLKKHEKSEEDDAEK